MTTLLALSFIPIINLNVERLAESKGWDKILSEHWGTIMSDLSRLASNPWFLVLVGLLAGGTLFMWGEYYLRRFRTTKVAVSPDAFTAAQVQDLLTHIERTRMELNEVDGVSHEGFHEAVALSMKLMQLGIPSPFMPEFRDGTQFETFSDKFCKYLAAITPYVREGNIKKTKHFAGAALKIVYMDQDDSISPDATGEPPSPQEPEGEKQP